MRLPEVSQFCCGCSLEIGAKVIAWVEVICALVSFADNLMLALDAYHEDLHNDSVVTIYFVNTVLALILAPLAFFFSVALYLGVQRKKSLILDYWVKFSITIQILRATYFAVTIPFLWAYELRNIEAFIVAITVLIVLSLNMYFIIVVASCRKEMSRRRFIPNPHHTEGQFTSDTIIIPPQNQENNVNN